MLTREAEKTSQILLDIGAVTLRPEDPFIFASGIKSPVYVDCRLLMRHPQHRRTIARLLSNQISFAERLLPDRFDVIAGTATAAIPHAAWVAERLEKPMAYVRSEAKGHGKQNRIAGLIKPGENVAVVEDLLTTGGSSIATIEALREAGAKADFVFAIMTYSMASARENFAAASVRLIVLATFNDVVGVAVQEEKIRPDQKETILDWVNDPGGWWNRRMGLE